MSHYQQIYDAFAEDDASYVVFQGGVGTGKTTGLPPFLSRIGCSSLDDTDLDSQPYKVWVIVPTLAIARTTPAYINQVQGAYLASHRHSGNKENTPISFLTYDYFYRYATGVMSRKFGECPDFLIIDECHNLSDIFTSVVLGAYSMIHDSHIIFMSATTDEDLISSRYTFMGKGHRFVSASAETSHTRTYYPFYQEPNFNAINFGNIEMWECFLENTALLLAKIRMHRFAFDWDVLPGQCVLVLLPGIKDLLDFQEAILTAYRKSREESESEFSSRIAKYPPIPSFFLVNSETSHQIPEPSSDRVQILLCTVGTAGAGVTIKNADIVLNFGYKKEVIFEVLQGVLMSKEEFHQCNGRVGRCKNGRVFLFSDPDALSEQSKDPADINLDHQYISTLMNINLSPKEDIPEIKRNLMTCLQRSYCACPNFESLSDLFFMQGEMSKILMINSKIHDPSTRFYAYVIGILLQSFEPARKATGQEVTSFISDFCTFAYDNVRQFANPDVGIDIPLYFRENYGHHLTVA